MVSKRNILAVLIAGLSLATANAYAKHGADDPTQPCDDHGTDLCYHAMQVAKDGADDPAEDLLDDNGVDFVLAKDGADDPVEDLLDDHGAA